METREVLPDLPTKPDQSLVRRAAAFALPAAADLARGVVRVAANDSMVHGRIVRAIYSRLFDRLIFGFAG